MGLTELSMRTNFTQAAPSGAASSLTEPEDTLPLLDVSPSSAVALS